MDLFETHILPATLAVASMVIWAIVLTRADRGARLCLGMYAGSYLLTTGIGSVLIAYWQQECADPAWGLNIGFIHEWNNTTYWLLLFLPFLLVPFIVLFSQNVETGKLLSIRSALQGSHINPLVYLCVLGTVGGYCIWELAANNYLTIYNWAAFENDFHRMIIKRTEIISKLRGIFFGAVYTGLPALSHVCVYQYFATRRKVWLALFAISALLIVYLTLSVLLKGMILVYFLIVCIGIIELKRIPLVGLAFVLFFLPIVLTIMQLFFVADWKVSDSIRLLIYRMAWSHVYYVNVFPAADPYVGLDFALNLIGMGNAPNDATKVFSYMYPQITHVQGACPAPAHTRAYAQGGLIFAAATTVAVGFFLSFVMRLRQRIRGPISFAFYMQCLCTLYYLSQGSLVDMIFAGYGMIWVVVTLGPLALWQFLMSPSGEADQIAHAPQVRATYTLAPPTSRKE